MLEMVVLFQRLRHRPAVEPVFISHGIVQAAAHRRFIARNKPQSRWSGGDVAVAGICQRLLNLEVTPLLRPILDVFEEGVCLTDEAGVVCGMNAAAERLWGCSEQALVGQPLRASLHIAGTVAPAQGTARLCRPDGGLLDVTYTVQPLSRDRAGPGLWKLRECANRQGCDTALRDSEAKLSAILDTISDGIIVIDEVGSIQLFTPGAERLFGYHRNEVFGHNVKMLMPSPYREAHDDYLASYRNTGIKKIIGIGREVSGQRKDGSVFPMYLSVGEMYLDGRRMFVGITHDLTLRKRAEEQLVMLSAAVDQSPAAVLIAALDGHIEYANRGFTELSGHRAEEVIGHNPCVSQLGDLDQTLFGNLCETVRDGCARRGEIHACAADGAWYWALETITPLRNAVGEMTHYLAIQQDITKQKHDKEVLAESEARSHQVAEMTGEWLWEQDPDGHYLYSSVAVRDILGFSPEEIRGKHYLDLLTPEDRQHWQGAAPGTGSDTPKPFHRLVNRYRHRDGREVYTESTGAPIFDEQGKLLKWRGVDHNITARKAFEDALRLRDRAIEAASVGIVITDAQAKGNPNIYVNPALSRITGYAREELLGNNMRLLQGPDTDHVAIEEIRQALKAGRSCEVVLKNYRKGGVPFWNELLIAPVLDEQGKLTHFIGIQTDVTERRRAEEDRHELEIAKHIQLSLLPDAPLRLPGAELAGVCVPASHVGGDYFDYFQLASAVDVVIADVSGHSVGAALIMSEVRSTLRAETRKAVGNHAGPMQILRDLNELLYDDLIGAELFITMFYLKYQSETQTLSYANAGHNRPLLLKAGQANCAELDAEGLVLGVRPDVEFEEQRLELSPGDQLLLYTDGVTEAQSAKGTFFGVDRLCASFSAYRALPPEALIHKLLVDVRAFCGNAPLHDDISMVILHVR